jgi:N-acetylmuramic acid 6-phosphate (MurNAc-6-P) etherase
MSTPGHSTSGAEGVGDAGWVTPGFALENKLVKRLVSEGESSDVPILEAHEQPDSIMALSMSNAAARPRFRLS